MNSANVYQPIVSDRVGPGPLMLCVVVTPTNAELTGGVQGSRTRQEFYVNMGMLPAELRSRVDLAVQAKLAEH